MAMEGTGCNAGNITFATTVQACQMNEAAQNLESNMIHAHDTSADKCEESNSIGDVHGSLGKFMICFLHQILYNQHGLSKLL
ncbi:hypothetical protein Pfo_001715 [Paulownia fortunei]|nr:hypothetical protein Pfo_001715 [Paulownia fortunei]